MNKGNERLLAILAWMRRMPRWALVLITLAIIVVLGVAMFLLIPQSPKSQEVDALQLSSSLAFSVFLKLFVVVIIIAGCAILLRRWQTKNTITNSKKIAMIETLHLSPRQTLYLVNVEGRKILIGGTDQSISMLAEYSFEDCDNLPAESDHPGDFADLLRHSKQQ